MKRSSNWKKKFRRQMAGCAIGGSVALSSAACYAAAAFDSASDPVYADGWHGQTHDDFGVQLTTGDNGGFGFTQWNFDSSYWWYGDPNRVFNYAAPGFKGIDDGLRTGALFSNPNNNIGRAWVMGQTPNLKDVNRAGRGFAPLQIGETFKLVLDNPTARPLGGGFTGYQLRLTGGTGGTNGSTCNGFGGNCTAHNPPIFPAPEMRFDVFQGPGGDPGAWHVIDAGGVDTLLEDIDTASAGAVFTVKRTGTATYDVVMHPLGGASDFVSSRTFADPGVAIDWFEITFYNSSNTATSPPNRGFSDMATTPTDLYIRSMEITAVPEPATATLLLLGAIGAAGRRRRRSET